MPTAVNGPYRNLPEPQDLAPGNNFYKSVVDKNGNKIEQKELILQANRNAHPGDGGGGEIHSDFAGFEYPCDGPEKPLCKEPLVLQVALQYADNAAQVHHVIRMNDQRCCAWGTNSNANAVVISGKLNRFFWYKYPSIDEVNWGKLHRSRLWMWWNRDHVETAQELERTIAAPIHAIIDAVTSRALLGPTELTLDELATLCPTPPNLKQLVAVQRRLQKVGITWPGSPEIPE